ncbi:MAG TPA: hypothetical protein VF753_04250 [Terriglobales bacterium]
MKDRRRVTMAAGWTLGLTAVLIIAAAAAAAPTLTFKYTKVNVKGAKSTALGGINNQGVIVGQYTDSAGAMHCFSLAGGKVTTINYPKVKSDNCIHINSTGDIVGSATLSSTQNLGFMYSSSTKKFTTVPGPKGAVSSVAYGINDDGVIVGEYSTSESSLHGFMLKGGKYTALNVPGATLTLATSINNSGEITLFAGIKGKIEAYEYNGKTYKAINVPKAANSFALDISNKGDIVFETLNSTGTQGSGALLHSGTYYTVQYPKSADSQATGLNDMDELVGYYQTSSIAGPDNGFSATY